MCFAHGWSDLSRSELSDCSNELDAGRHPAGIDNDAEHESQWTSSRARSDRSTAHPIAQVKHPVALNRHVRILQQVLRVDRPEVTLAGPEHDGCDVHAHLVDQARGKHLATDVASGDLDHAVPRELLGLGHGCLDPVDEVKRRLGVAALGLRPVRHDDHVVDPARRLAAPAVRQVEDVAATIVTPIWSQYARV
jgi:hypothetical protein